MIILGFTGKKKSGKDTACQMLRELGYNVYRVGFADALKEEASRMLCVSVAFIEEHKDEFRPFLQWLGTDFRRLFFGDNYWVAQAVYRIKNAPPCEIVAVTDVRFPNEALAIRSLGGHIIRVRRVETDSIIDAHASEAMIDSIEPDYNLYNNASLLELKTQLAFILKGIQ